MNTFTPIDLSILPAPNVLEDLDYEALLADRKAYLVSLYPEPARAEIEALLELESEPLTKLLQENTYRELLLRQRVNEAAKAVMLPFATGTDLDQIAARYNLNRLTIIAANPNAVPPIAAVMESDAALRERTQMALEGLSVAGPRNAYIFHARSADGRVADATAVSPVPWQVVVTIQSALGDGTASPELLAVVDAYLSADDRRPVCDQVMVQSATIVPYTVEALLHLSTLGPEAEIIRQTAEQRLQALLTQRRRLGLEINRSAIDAALHIEGVKRVDLVGWSDVVAEANEAPYCTAYSVTVAP